MKVPKKVSLSLKVSLQTANCLRAMAQQQKIVHTRGPGSAQQVGSISALLEKWANLWTQRPITSILEAEIGTTQNAEAN